MTKRTPGMVDRLLDRVEKFMQTSDAPYDFAFYWQDLLDAGVYMGRIVNVRQVTLPAKLQNSRAVARVAPTAAAQFTIYKVSLLGVNTVLGNINFAVGALTGSFVFNKTATFHAGETLAILAPTIADATLADVSVTLKGIRVV